MSSFAIYRLPFAGQYTKMVQHSEPVVLSSVSELNGRSGFVIAPFSPSDECPILLMQPDEIQAMEIPKTDDASEIVDARRLQGSDEANRESYHRDFSLFHQQLKAGNYAKLVLSRCVSEPLQKGLEAEEIFFRACRLYPRQFVAMFSTPKSGTWLMATPEILLDGNADAWRTMALAGTMQHCEDGVVWSEKNREEQQYVARYIRERLEEYAEAIQEDGPYTTQAADLVHLRTDFTFRLKQKNAIGNLLESLHPTPAVCGIPKEAAHDYILATESSHRRYYSGFAGPLNWQNATHLYVSLRCMQVEDGHCRLYAGGGILKESTEESEWMETEAKLATMRQLLR